MSAILLGRSQGLLVVAISLLCFGSAAAWSQAPAGEPTTTPKPATTQPPAGEGGGQASAAGKAPAVPAVVVVPENWTELPLPAGSITPPPATILRGTFPEFTREFMPMEWRPGDEIDLYVLKPVGVEKPPVILYLYSFPTDKDRFVNDEFAKVATRNGYAAVGFVSALTGQRYRDRPQKEWFVSELQEALGESVHDVQHVLNYLETRGDLDMTRVGIFGDGSGASIAIMAAAVDPRIKTLDLFEPWGDWPDWLAKSTLVPEDERASYLKPEFLKKVAPLDPVTWLSKLTTQQVRLQFVDGNTITPGAAVERMRAAAPSKATLTSYANSRQFVVSMGGISQERLFDWLKEQMGPADAEHKAAAHQGGESSQLNKN